MRAGCKSRYHCLYFSKGATEWPWTFHLQCGHGSGKTARLLRRCRQPPAQVGSKASIAPLGATVQGTGREQRLEGLAIGVDQHTAIVGEHDLAGAIGGDLASSGMDVGEAGQHFRLGMVQLEIGHRRTLPLADSRKLLTALLPASISQPLKTLHVQDKDDSPAELHLSLFHRRQWGKSGRSLRRRRRDKLSARAAVGLDDLHCLFYLRTFHSYEERDITDPGESARRADPRKAISC